MQTVQNLRAEHFGSYSSFSICTHSSVYWVFWPSDGVVDCNIMIIFRHSTTVTCTMLLTTRILRTATKWCASPQIINRNMQKNYIPSLIRILHFDCYAIKS